MVRPTNRPSCATLCLLLASLSFACSKAVPGGSEAPASKQETNRLFKAASAATGPKEPISQEPVVRPATAQIGVETGEPPATEKKNEAPPSVAMAARSDDDATATGSSLGATRRWNVYRPEDAERPKDHRPAVTNVGFSSDGKLAFSVASARNPEDPAIIVAWNIATGNEALRLEGPGWQGFYGLTLSPDDRQIAVVDYESEVILLDIRSGEETLRFDGEAGYPAVGSFSPDGQFFLGGGYRRSQQALGFSVWDATTGEKVQAFSGPRWSPDSLFFSSEGRRRVLLGGEQVWLWDYVTGEVVKEYGAAQLGAPVAFAPDERHALSRQGTLWHLGSGRPLVRTSSPLILAEFLPEGDRFIALGRDFVCRLWDAGTGKEIMPLQDSETRTAAFALSPDGRQALTGDRDGTVRLWAIDDQAIDDYRPPVASEKDEPIAQRPAYESLPPGRERDEAEIAYRLQAGRESVRRLKPDEAAEHYEKAMILAERVHGPESVDQMHEVNHVANRYEVRGEFEKAEYWYQRYLDGCMRESGPDSPEVAAALQSLARLYYPNMDRFAEAEQLALRRIEIFKAFTKPPYKDRLPWAWNDLFHLYREADDLQKAEQALLHTHQAWVEAYGEQSFKVGNNYDALVHFYRRTLQDNEKAEPYMMRALEHAAVEWGRNHPVVEGKHVDGAVFYASLKRFDRVQELLDRAVRIRFDNMVSMLASLSESEQERTLRNVEHNIHLALWFALERRDDPEVARRSAEWIANVKGMATRAVAERARMALRSTNPDVRKNVEQLTEVRNRLASLSMSGPASDDGADYFREQDSLRKQHERIVQELALAGWDEMGRQEWVPLEAIREALPPDSVLIDCIRVRSSSQYERKLPQFDWTEDRYAAWVVPPAGQGDVQLLDLGPAKRIDEAVLQFHQALEITQLFIRRNGERKSEAMLRDALRPVSRFIVNRLERHLSDVPHWIISPDSALALLPWGALPVSGRAYAIESHTISYLVSGRDVIPQTRAPQMGPPVIVADPDYDLGLPATHQGPKPFVRLPGTAVEADRIAPLLARYANESPTVLRKAEAREEAVKSLVQPRAIVLSTHGFFAPFASQFQNPLLCCGLAFAGANQTHDADESTEEDGILTGMEVVGLDLRGTELVVLSACQTGLGKTRPGEGVVGLRQAFQLAGADALVATLWSIPDLETVDLTSSFFAHLAAGKGKAAALRAAKLDVIRSRREKSKAAHPVFWAAFTLTGSWD